MIFVHLFYLQGCTSGAVVSIGLSLLLGIGSTINGLNGNLPNQKLPLSTEGCFLNDSTTVVPSTWIAELPSNTMSRHEVAWKEEEYSGIINLFSVSYIWHPFVAVVGTVILGLIFSLIVNLFVEPKHPIKASYLSPLVVKMWRKILSDDWYYYWIDDGGGRDKEKVNVDGPAQL